MGKALKKYFKKKTKDKNVLVILFVVILSLLIIFYPLDEEDVQRITSSRLNKTLLMYDITVYPGSTKLLEQQTEDRLTFNYRTGIGVDYNQVISFYLEKMPKFGWQIVSSSEYKVVFTKGEKTIKVWILYTPDFDESGIDYIIDYYY